jgi:hypothetical protein
LKGLLEDVGDGNPYPKLDCKAFMTLVFGGILMLYGLVSLIPVVPSDPLNPTGTDAPGLRVFP